MSDPLLHIREAFNLFKDLLYRDKETLLQEECYEALVKIHPLLQKYMSSWENPSDEHDFALRFRRHVWSRFVGALGPKRPKEWDTWRPANSDGQSCILDSDCLDDGITPPEVVDDSTNIEELAEDKLPPSVKVSKRSGIRSSPRIQNWIPGPGRDSPRLSRLSNPRGSQTPKRMRQESTAPRANKKPRLNNDVVEESPQSEPTITSNETCPDYDLPKSTNNKIVGYDKPLSIGLVSPRIDAKELLETFRKVSQLPKLSCLNCMRFFNDSSPGSNKIIECEFRGIDKNCGACERENKTGCCFRRDTRSQVIVLRTPRGAGMPDDNVNYPSRYAEVVWGKLVDQTEEHMKILASLVPYLDNFKSLVDDLRARYPNDIGLACCFGDTVPEAIELTSLTITPERGLIPQSTKDSLEDATY